VGWVLVGVASVHNMKFLLLALKFGSADLLIECAGRND
jgi:hypothetical protein